MGDDMTLTDLERMTDSRDTWKQIAHDYEERLARHEALIAELVEALDRAESALLDSERHEEADACRAKIIIAKQHMGVEK